MLSSSRTRRAQSLVAHAVRYELGDDVVRDRKTVFQVARALDALEAVDGDLTVGQANELHAAVDSLMER